MAVRELLKYSPRWLCMLFSAFFAVTLLVSPRGSYALELENVNVDRYDFDIVEREVFAVYISPILDYVTVECKPLEYGNPFDLSVSSNYTDPIFGRITAVWMQPEAYGRYNLTIAFQTDAPWDYTLGIYPGEWSVSGTRLSGNWKINVLLESHSRSGSSPPFFFPELPAPVNSLLLMTMAGGIAYLNVFLFLDTYFKSKKEIVSGKRWLFVGLVAVISGWAVYQFYSFAAFVLPPLG